MVNGKGNQDPFSAHNLSLVQENWIPEKLGSWTTKGRIEICKEYFVGGSDSLRAHTIGEVLIQIIF